MTSRARLPSRMMRFSASLASFMSGVGALSHPRAVWALVMAPATGWRLREQSKR